MRCSTGICLMSTMEIPEQCAKSVQDIRMMSVTPPRCLHC